MKYEIKSIEERGEQLVVKIKTEAGINMGFSMSIDNLENDGYIDYINEKLQRLEGRAVASGNIGVVLDSGSVKK
ncbi:MAG: hypothetical protein EOL97_14970 [Spirochaetia bacterium]|nr:hypothetical protein [Spirochaetia bacterium]